MALEARKIIAFVLFLLLVFAARFAFGQSMIVAVERFTNTSKMDEYEWFSSAIADTVTSDLQAVSGIKVIDQSEVVLKQLELGISDLVSSKHQLRIGEALAANTIVVGAFQILGGQIQITAKFVNVESTEVIKGTKVFGKIVDFFELQSKITLNLLQDMNAYRSANNEAPMEITQSTKAEIDDQPTENIKALPNFAEAISLILENRRDDAIRGIPADVDSDAARFYIAAERGPCRIKRLCSNV